MDIVISRETNKRMYNKQVNKIKIKILTNLKESQERNVKIILNRQFNYKTNKSEYRTSLVVQ